MISVYICVFIAPMFEHAFVSGNVASTEYASVQEVPCQFPLLAKGNEAHATDQLKVFTDSQSMFDVIGFLMRHVADEGHVVLEPMPGGESKATS